MSFLLDTPYTPCFIRNQFFFDEQEGHGEFTHGFVFGFRAEPQGVPVFQVMLENGAQWARVPVHMICSKPCDPLPLDICVWWDSFGRCSTVHQFNFLKNMPVDCYGRDKITRRGNYIFTIDWAKDGWSEIPDQHKNHHIISLNTGQWVAYPNNKTIWPDASWIKPDVNFKWKSPSKSYSVESNPINYSI